MGGRSLMRCVLNFDDKINTINNTIVKQFRFCTQMGKNSMNTFQMLMKVMN